MKPSQVFKLQMWSAVEYLVGYEFQVWRKGKWVRAAQWKLEPFLTQKQTENNQK